MLCVGANCTPPGEGHLRKTFAANLVCYMIVCSTSIRNLSLGTKAAASNRVALFSIQGSNFRCRASVPPGLPPSVPHSRSKSDVPIPKFISRCSTLLSISFSRRAYHSPCDTSLFLYHLLQSLSHWKLQPQPRSYLPFDGASSYWVAFYLRAILSGYIGEEARCRGGRSE
jgi:hypothetical protein